MTATTIYVAMAEIQVIKGPCAFSVSAIGGGVAILALDAEAGVGGCAYYLLPETIGNQNQAIERPGKYGSTAIPEMIAMMERMGAVRKRIVVAAIGGTQFFKIGDEEAESSLDLGSRNIDIAKKVVKDFGLKLVYEDLGGYQARTLTFGTGGGELLVRTQGAKDKLVANLRRQAVKA